MGRSDLPFRRRRAGRLRLSPSLSTIESRGTSDVGRVPTAFRPPGTHWIQEVCIRLTGEWDRHPWPHITSRQPSVPLFRGCRDTRSCVYQGSATGTDDGSRSSQYSRRGLFHDYHLHGRAMQLSVRYLFAAINCGTCCYGIGMPAPAFWAQPTDEPAKSGRKSAMHARKGIIAEQRIDARHRALSLLPLSSGDGAPV
jgi:hypothetical protein